MNFHNFDHETIVVRTTTEDERDIRKHRRMYKRAVAQTGGPTKRKRKQPFSLKFTPNTEIIIKSPNLFWPVREDKRRYAKYPWR